MIKKTTALAIALTMLFSLTAFGANFPDVVSDGSEVSDAVNVLSELGIISGMGDGTFSPYSSLTRAQMAKIAVCIMGKTEEAVATTDAFSDVNSTHWYSGYVNSVAKDGIITGYPDGRFGAEDKLTYAQAITIIVRLLGYDASDVGYKWPQGYIEKAAVLNLTENMSFSVNNEISRIEASLLIYRALFTDMKDTKNALITKMDKNVYEDTVILATNKENASLLVNEVQTDKQIFTFDGEIVNMAEAVGKEGTLVVNDDNKVIAFVADDNLKAESYTVSALYREGNSDKVSLVTQDGEVVLVSTKAQLYLGGEAYTADKLVEGLNPGSKVTLFRENGSLKYVFVEEYKNLGPVTVMDTGKVKNIFNVTDAENTKVVRKGIAATWDDIEMFDVLYYSEKTNTIYAYCDRVTGMYEEAYPMKANVSRVTVSGTEYAVSSMAAVNKLNETKGAFNIGDRVTLLFGEDGLVVDAVSLTYADYSMYGVVTGSGREISTKDETKGRTEYYVNIMHADGREAKYVVEDDEYADKAGKLCVVDFENSFATLTFVKETTVSGFVNADMKFIGTTKISDEVKILEYVGGTAETAEVIKLTLADISSLKIEKKDVKCVAYNPKGEIEVLYLDNVTGSRDVYGVVIKKDESEDARGNKAGAYTILSGNDEYKVSGIYYPAIDKGDCVKYVKNGNAASLVEMTPMATGTKVELVVDNVITIDGKQYTLSDDAVIYVGEVLGNLKTATWLDAVGLEGKVSVYSEKTLYTGGKIKVVKILTE